MCSGPPRVFLSKKAGAELDLALIGRRGRDYYKRTNRQVTGEWVDLFSKPIEFAAAKKIAGQLIERYTREEVDAVYLLHNEFKGVLSQKILLEPLLPMRPAGGNEGARQEYIYEQAPETIFRDLLPRYIQVSVYHAMLESAAAEHASRMTAMDAATRNAGEMVEKLTLHLNRVRQASITNDLIEVVSGAQALE